jgi:CheY-like chemotaxis protein
MTRIDYDQKRPLLHLDDDPGMRQAVRTLAEAEGYEIVSFEDAESLVVFVESGLHKGIRPAGLVSDGRYFTNPRERVLKYVMPETVKRVRGMVPDLPVLVLSDAEQADKDAADLGAIFVSKNLSRGGFTGRVCDWISELPQ